MKLWSLFSSKNIINLSSAKFAQRVVTVSVIKTKVLFNFYLWDAIRIHTVFRS